MPDFKIKIKTEADLAGAQASLAALQGQIEATKRLGQNVDDLTKKEQKLGRAIIQAEIKGITGKMKESGEAAAGAAKGVDKMELSHRQLHIVLQRVAPSLAGIAHFLQSGFAGAIGIALIGFEFLNKKIEQFSQYMQQFDTGPGARGEWAEKIRDNVREAAVEIAVFNQRLEESINKQKTAAESADRAVQANKDHAADAKTLATAQKELEIAKLELYQKLNQITPEQAVRIRLKLDDQAFKAELAADLASIKVELEIRKQQHDLTANNVGIAREHKESADDAATAAKNAAEKNTAKLAQDKNDLEALKAGQLKQQQGMQLDDFIPNWIQKFAREGSPINLGARAPAQIEEMIAQKTRAVAQETAKQTALDTAAALAKDKQSTAAKHLDELVATAGKLTETVDDLEAKLAKETAKNNALADIHSQITDTKLAGSQAPLAVAAGQVQIHRAMEQDQGAHEVETEQNQFNDLFDKAAAAVNQANDAAHHPSYGAPSIRDLMALISQLTTFIANHPALNPTDRDDMQAEIASLKQDVTNLTGQITNNR